VAFDLYALGERLTRARLRRLHPRACEASIEAMYVKLLYQESDAKWSTASKLRSRRLHKI
jgi:hypothetical protein